jgi:predicted metalloprotease
MRYEDQDRESKNVEDRRGQESAGFPGMRGGIQIPMGGGGLSFTTMLIIGALMLLFGMNPLDLLRGMGQGGGGIEIPLPQGGQPGARTGDNPFRLPGRGASTAPPADDQLGVFVKRVLADTEDVWGRAFKSFGKTYEEPKLVMFSGATRTGCGTGQTAMGPFYCPNDRKVYIDLAFYEQMKRQFNAGGDFAQAYVVAHEVGHHVQTLLGISDKVQQLKESMNEKQSNALQVRMELQADCLAGVWANLNEQLRPRLEQGDIEEALNAASQIGDDMIQKKMTGRIVPDAFTHGTAAQRVKWFKQGISTGNIQSCDTFNSRDLG